MYFSHCAQLSCSMLLGLLRSGSIQYRKGPCFAAQKPGCRVFFQNTQCGNYRSLLSHFFDKTFCESFIFLKKLLKSWFDEIFSVRVNFSIFCTVHKVSKRVVLEKDTFFTTWEALSMNGLECPYTFSFEIDYYFWKIPWNRRTIYQKNHRYTNTHSEEKL